MLYLCFNELKTSKWGFIRSWTFDSGASMFGVIWDFEENGDIKVGLFNYCNDKTVGNRLLDFIFPRNMLYKPYVTVTTRRFGL